MFSNDPEKETAVYFTTSNIKTSIFDGKKYRFEDKYRLHLKVKMRSCVSGEIYLKKSKQCYKCHQKTFSIDKNSIKCLECPKIGV